MALGAHGPRLLSAGPYLHSPPGALCCLGSRWHSVGCAVARQSLQARVTENVNPWRKLARQEREDAEYKRNFDLQSSKDSSDSGYTAVQVAGNSGPSINGDEVLGNIKAAPEGEENGTSSFSYFHMGSGVQSLAPTGNSLLLEADFAIHARRNSEAFEGKPLVSALAAGAKYQEVNAKDCANGARNSWMDATAEGRRLPSPTRARSDGMNGNTDGMNGNTSFWSRVYSDRGLYSGDQHHKLIEKQEDFVNGVSLVTLSRKVQGDDEAPSQSRSETTEFTNHMPKADYATELQETAVKSQTSAMPAESKKNAKDVKTDKLVCSVEDVLIVDNLSTAKRVIKRLRGDYRHYVQACDTEVADIDVKKESPVGHGKVICFSIYCGPEADFGDGKTCVWVDLLDTDEEIVDAFKEYFQDSSIKKVWHNFSFDRHVLANRGIKAAGFHADTMHLARLWNSGRKGAEGGYSLEALTSDAKVMNGVHTWDAQTIVKKTPMKDLFGENKMKKDGTEGKVKILPSMEEIQRSKSQRERWICYSSGDAICTWRLWESLQAKLRNIIWVSQGRQGGNMYDFYNRFWLPFGELLADMEAEGMLVDQKYLAEIEEIASKERALSISRFRKWATKYCPDAQHINVTSDSQIRQLLFGGFQNVPKSRRFNVPNVDGYIEPGNKAPKKYRSIEIRGIGIDLRSELCTSSGLPAVSMDALKALAGKVSIDYSEVEEDSDGLVSPDSDENMVLTSAGIRNCEGIGAKGEEDISVYGKAYHAFKGGQEGKEACKAIAALCEVSAIDTLLSSFIKPLQNGDILGPDGRVHCSLNLNTETGRLSARRPNLQNQPALEKDRYKIRQAFIASPGNSLIVADYGQLELRLLAHLANCRSMLDAFKVGGDFHSRTAMNMYDHVKKAVECGEVLLEWEPKSLEESPLAPLLKDVYGSERRKAKMLNFSIAYGKTARGLAKDWKVTLEEAQKTVDLWYRDRHEVREWQQKQKMGARNAHCVHTLLGRARHFPNVALANSSLKGHIDRAAINTPVQGSAADVAMLAMLEIVGNAELKELGWKLLLQVHDEMILEGPTESADIAKSLVVQAMSHPFNGTNILNVELAVDAKYAKSWYAAK